MSDTVLNDAEKQTAVAAMVAALITEYVKNQPLPVDQIPAVFAEFKREIEALWGCTPAEVATAPVEENVEKQTPAAIRKSVKPEAITSFIDGKPYKTLTRHLTKHGLTPDTYRQKFGLPADYPMTCSAYSEQRSQLARNAGLGQRRAA